MEASMMRVVDHVAEHAKSQPERVAVTCRGDTTYAQLASRMDAIAHVLQQQDVKKGEYVGVMLERSADLVASLLAILKVGAVYIPLDPLYPAERCAVMMEDAAARALVTTTDLAPEFVSLLADDTCIIDLEDDVPEGGAPAANALPPRAADDVAYCIFTSGSTGRPKGVPICHASLMNFLASFRDELQATARDRVVALTTMCFDIAGLEIWLPLAVGGTVLMASREEAMDPELLSDFVKTHEPTIMQATPTTWRMLLRFGWAGRKGLKALCGGEGLPIELKEDLLKRVGSLWNVYGPTETTIWSSVWKAVAGVAVQIGEPIRNTTLHILDDDMQPVAEGDLGSLWIGGDGLSPGYLNNQELTDKVFKAAPGSGERIYNSGDLAKRVGGALYCCGRKDLQIKLRGYRIEVDEIASILKRHPLVADCCVGLKPQAEAGEEQQLVAWIVTRSSGEIKRIVSGSDISTLTDTRFASLCKGSLVRINSLLDGGARKDLSADLEEINNWGAIYDEAYATQNAANADPSLNFSGYDNSYTPRVPHQIPVVREWVETTCERIASLRPRRALEMGAGQGMIMLRVAKVARELYIACDLSQFSVNFCKEILEKDSRFHLPHVVMDVAGAHEADRYAHERLDTVICNGVSMYFPSADYLLSVIRTSVGAVQAGGAFYLGDVRANTLFPHFHASVQLYQAADDMPVDELKTKVLHSLKFEKEFLVDHDLFLALGDAVDDLAEVRLDMKRGEYHSEFSCFRYDVYFWRADPAAPRKPATYDLTPYDADAHSLEALEAALGGEGAPEVFALARVPDARTVEAGEAVRVLRGGDAPATCGELRKAVESAAAARRPLEPEALYRLGAAAGYHVEMTWSPQDECAMDVLFVKEARKFAYETVAIASRRAAGLFPPAKPPALASFTSKTFDAAAYFAAPQSPSASPVAPVLTVESANTGSGSAPGEAGAASSAVASASRASSGTGAGDEDEEQGFPLTMNEIREWKGMLRLCVPEYMVPSIFMRVPALPQTANGKVDRKALPPPTEADLALNHNRDPANFVPPVGATQTQLALMWGELLHMTDVSAGDDFFEAGGHSLLAMQLATSILKTFGVRLPMAKLAAYSRLDKLAALIDASRGDGDGAEAADAATAGSAAPAQAVPQVQITVISPEDLPAGNPEVVPHRAVRMDDGVELSAKLWLPRRAAPAPALVEINPYRKGDGTVEIDALTFPYFAAHGHPCVRVDSRGAGDSQGALDDEYSPRQIADAAAVVEWAAAQPWCSGEVVLFGVSWSGFIAMQVAALEAPPAALRGVISVCATDSRYDDDMHYQGGALLAENLSWSSWLLHTLSQPPDALAAGADWLPRWRERAAALEPKAGMWMRHGREDAYWAHGSVKHAYDNLRVPLLLLGGTHGGGYHNSVARMAARVRNAPVRAVVGPWSHNMPHVSPLGPQTGYLQDCLDWLGELASSDGSGGGDMGGFTAFAEAPSHAKPLASAASTLCGRWLRFPSADAAAGAVKEAVLRLGGEGALEPAAEAGAPGRAVCVDSTVDGVADGAAATGLAGGRWMTFGDNDDMPTEQSADDALCTAFELPAALEDTLILGRPAVSLAIADGATCGGHVVARLAAVAPNGVSHRVTWGVLNVGKAEAAGEPLTVQIHYTAYTMPKGYKLRLLLSRDYFPLVWPDVRAAAKAPLPVRTSASVLRLPQAPCSDAAVAGALDAAVDAVTTTVHVPAGSDVTRKGRSVGRRVVTQRPEGLRVDIFGAESEVDLGSAAAGLCQRSVCKEALELRVVDDVVVPVHEVTWETRGVRDGGEGAMDATSRLTATLTGGPETLTLEHRLELRSGDEVVAERKWCEEVPAAAL